MARKLTPTTFVSGIDKELAVVDAYKKNDSKVVNSITKFLEEQGLDVGGVFGDLAGGDLGGLISGLADGKLNVVAEDLINRLGVVGPLKDSWKQLGDDVKSGMSTLNISPGMQDKIFATLGDTTSKVLGGDLSSVTGISKVINNVCNGNFNISAIDKGGIAALCGGLVKEATGLGLPNVFSSLARGINDKDILKAVARDIIPFAAKGGNLGLLEDIALTAINGDMKSMLPKLGSELLKSIGINVRPDKLSSLYNRVNSLLDNNSPGWNSYNRNNQRVIYGVKIAQPNYIKLLESYAKIHNTTISKIPDPNNPMFDEDHNYMMLMKVFDSTTVQKCLDRDFPKTKVIANKRMTKPYIKDLSLYR